MPCLRSRHEVEVFFTQLGVPTQAGKLALKREDALNCELGDLTLRHCGRCGHIWNSSLDLGKLGFDANYNISLYYSATYREYVVRCIERLKSRYRLAGQSRS